MYGLGGGFGGMNYESPGSAIVKGIEAGQNFMFRAQQEKDRQQQLQIQMSREDRRDRMEQAHMQFMERNEDDRNKRDAWKQAYDMHKEMGEELTAEGNDIRGRYRKPDGSLDTQAAMADPQYPDYASRVQKWNVGRDALMDSAYGPFLKKGFDRAKEYSDGLVKQNDGVFDVSNPDNAQHLHHLVSACTLQDPANFLQGPNGESSKFEDASGQLQKGFTNQDAKALYTGAQSIFGNQFEAGRLGYMDPLGGTVMSAQLNKDKPFVPTPDGNAVHPVMTVGGETEDGFTTQPAAAPYQAGFDHPTSTGLMAFTPGKALDQLGGMGVMQKLVSHPVVQANLAQACKNPDQFNRDFAMAYTARGNKPSLGGMHFTRENDDGGVSQMYAPYLPNGGVGPATEIANSRGAKKPDKPDRTAFFEKNAAIDDAEAKNIITHDEAIQARKAELGIGVKDKGPNEASVKLQSDIEGELAEARSGQMRSPLSPTGYVDAIKRDASGEPILDEDGKPQIDKAVQSQIDRHIKGLEARLESVRKGFNEQGRPASASATSTIGQGSPEEQQESDQVTALLSRAQQNPKFQNATPQQIIEQAIARGVLKPTARRLIQPGSQDVGQPVGPRGTNTGQGSRGIELRGGG